MFQKHLQFLMYESEMSKAGIGLFDVQKSILALHEKNPNSLMLDIRSLTIFFVEIDKTIIGSGLWSWARLCEYKHVLFLLKLLENTFQIQFLFILDTENIKCLVYTKSCKSSLEKEK